MALASDGQSEVGDVRVGDVGPAEKDRADAVWTQGLGPESEGEGKGESTRVWVLVDEVEVCDVLDRDACGRDNGASDPCVGGKGGVELRSEDLWDEREVDLSDVCGNRGKVLWVEKDVLELLARLGHDQGTARDAEPGVLDALGECEAALELGEHLDEGLALVCSDGPRAEGL